ncbi:MAG: prenyltransferase/squalene oxidase repeat-containing protein [Acidobacteriota bacterium]
MATPNVRTATHPAGAPAREPADLDAVVAAARDALLQRQHPAGCWEFELEADCTIPSEYILMGHFLGDVDEVLQRKLAAYVRDRQADHGGWPLFHGGEFEMSCSVKSYWALKLAGDDPQAPHMRRAREAILAHGGATKANVFTRITMALFGQIPWRGTPFLPVEIVLLPRWFPFHLSKVSYWSRTVMVPLAILCSLRAKAVNPTGMNIRELFRVPPEAERRYHPVRSPLNRVFLTLERTVRLARPFIPGFVRRRALAEAENWFVERLNGTDGLGAIFPAMVNALEALAALGYAEDHPRRRQAREALDRLLVVHESWAYCQPCVSPIWDTALAALALHECGDDEGPGGEPTRHGSPRDERGDAAGDDAGPGGADHADGEEPAGQRIARATGAAVMAGAVSPVPEPVAPVAAALARALDWLEARQVTAGPGDWQFRRPSLAPGGWAFQYNNAHYPDLDDTSAMGWALAIHDRPARQASLNRAADWVVGMQSRGGGYASFDVDNTCEYLDAIPFADHGALLDPPTADVSARTLLFLRLLDRPADCAAVDACLSFILDEQEDDGAWFGRWGTNYIYGTWSVLAALEFVDDARKQVAVRRAVAWLKSVQRADGSWGEGNDTYFYPRRAGQASAGTSFQTAWALLGLMAAGEAGSGEVRRGVDWLIATRRADGLWQDAAFTAPGFPKVFYLKYHGYSAYFPLWALARYRREAHRRAS